MTKKTIGSPSRTNRSTRNLRGPFLARDAGVNDPATKKNKGMANNAPITATSTRMLNRGSRT